MIVIAVAVVLILSSSGGKSSLQHATVAQSTGTGTNTTSTTRSTHHTRPSSHHVESTPPAASPSATAVAVLNGTSTNGLAHSLSSDLQQNGYSQAAALNGTPPGSHASTVVEYASGHRADAQGVAKALSVTQVQPMEATVASLAGAATVVVIAGEDKASAVSETSSGGGASSATGQ